MKTQSNTTINYLLKPAIIKKLKFILSIAIAVILFSGCSKSKKDKKYVLKGRMMYSCDTPAANTSLNLYEGLMFFGKSGGFITSFSTDDNGYFKVEYTSASTNGRPLELNYAGSILEDIPSRENIDIGEVLWGTPPISFVIRLEVEKAYTEQDTLVIPDFNNGNNFAKKYLPGPFKDTVLDTIMNFPYIGNIQYKMDSKMKFISWLTSNQKNWYKTTISVSSFCTDNIYEAIIRIE